MIQDIAPHHFNNRYDSSISPDSSSLIFCFEGENLLLMKDFSLPTGNDVQPANPEYLFSFDNISCFLSLERPDKLPVSGSLCR